MTTAHTIRSGEIAVYRKISASAVPGPEMRYYFLTTGAGRQVRRIDNAVLEDGEPFEWDATLFVQTVNDDAEAVAFFTDAVPVGQIDADHALQITDRWQIPMGWGEIGGSGVLVTSTRWVGAPSTPHWATHYDGDDEPCGVRCECILGDDHDTNV
ncbi:hypothetical protein [Nocardia tengchongensis]|uniref:hypothetical protein n=1 Tax=Nocardia tengchongensis TaxID=2055889 RepID=UPI00365E4ECA